MPLDLWMRRRIEGFKKYPGAGPRQWTAGRSEGIYCNLTGMLEIAPGNVVVAPKLPKHDDFVIARVSGGYELDRSHFDDFDFSTRWRHDFGHVIRVDSRSIRILKRSSTGARV